MDDDRIRWNARWRERGQGHPEPDPPSSLVTARADLLPTRGRALDIAGGAGRHALWLARRGLDVTLVDISEVALDLAQRAAGQAGLPLHTLQRDLEREPLPEGPWDLILCFHYLQRSLFPRIPALLAPGGVFLIVHQTHGNLLRHERPSARFLLADGELPTLVGLALREVHYEEGWLAEGRHEAVLLATNPP
ncbi:class I SAM-dependent methyltransferase [Chondromyces apiculatus]|uniref:Methyltransferase type 12 n=1 Tax=Chondromyces apiculatus DSM 436 TaxID=1192034 RepID=A0A017TED9_9BACT|nr:class I SAM-dependent methyltransferase [Chondromyces apiculatus]EYF07292.1 Methyltransferase type 12 [Chondromyces apiculatus DSM 436]